VGTTDGEIDARDARGGILGSSGSTAGLADAGKMRGNRIHDRKPEASVGAGKFWRGFRALTDDVEVQYKCTGTYNGKAESTIRWDDPAIGIEWPMRDVIISEKDQKAQTLAEWLASPDARNFVYPTHAVSA
jgi:hypothetical protein